MRHSLPNEEGGPYKINAASAAKREEWTWEGVAIVSLDTRETSSEPQRTFYLGQAA